MATSPFPWWALSSSGGYFPLGSLRSQAQVLRAARKSRWHAFGSTAQVCRWETSGDSILGGQPSIPGSKILSDQSLLSFSYVLRLSAKLVLICNDRSASVSEVLFPF